MEYKVGQILYICDENRMKIIPIQVVEEVVRTTISGIEKNYMVMFPDTKRSTASIDKIRGKLFNDPETVQDYMIKNASDAIKRMRKAAEALRDEAFGTQKENIDVQIKNDVQVETNNDIIMVDLGNGVKAKMNTSSLEKVTG